MADYPPLSSLVGALQSYGNNGIDWSRLNQPFGSITGSDPNTIGALGRGRYGAITQNDLNKAINLGLSFSGGGLTTGTLKIPNELYHVVGSDYAAGAPLRSLYSRFGNDAYDMYANRWPEAGDLSQYHVHNIFFHDNLTDALEHVDAFGGKVLRVDPSKVEGLYLDTLEKPYGKPGIWATKSDVLPEALKEIK